MKNIFISFFLLLTLTVNSQSKFIDIECLCGLQENTSKNNVSGTIGNGIYVNDDFYSFPLDVAYSGTRVTIKEKAGSKSTSFYLRETKFSSMKNLKEYLELCICPATSDHVHEGSDITDLGDIISDSIVNANITITQIVDLDQLSYTDIDTTGLKELIRTCVTDDIPLSDIDTTGFVSYITNSVDIWENYINIFETDTTGLKGLIRTCVTDDIALSDLDTSGFVTYIQNSVDIWETSIELFNTDTTGLHGYVESLDTYYRPDSTSSVTVGNVTTVTNYYTDQDGNVVTTSYEDVDKEDKLMQFNSSGVQGYLFLDGINGTNDFVPKIVCESDIEVSKEILGVLPNPINIGDLICYEVVITNNGGDQANSVVLNDILPCCLDYATATSSQNSDSQDVNYDWGNGIANIGRLSTGDDVTMQICGKVTCSPILNFATVSSENYDPNLSNNTDTVKIEFPLTDLSITKEFTSPTEPDSLNLGDAETSFEIEVCNNGVDVLTDSYVSDVLPLGMVFKNANCEIGSYDPTLNLWVIPSGWSDGDCFKCDFEVFVNNLVTYVNRANIENPLISEINSSNNTDLDTIFYVDCGEFFPPNPLVITESQCNSGIYFNGLIEENPLGTCNGDQTPEFSLDGGATWSSDLPEYVQDSSIVINYRCECKGEYSEEKTITTEPNSCTDNHLSVLGSGVSVDNLSNQTYEIINCETGHIDTFANGAAYESFTTLDNKTTIPLTGGSYKTRELLSSGCYCYGSFEIEASNICESKAFAYYKGRSDAAAAEPCFPLTIDMATTSLEVVFKSFAIADGFTIEYEGNIIGSSDGSNSCVALATNNSTYSFPITPNVDDFITVCICGAGGVTTQTIWSIAIGCDVPAESYACLPARYPIITHNESGCPLKPVISPISPYQDGSSPSVFTDGNIVYPYNSGSKITSYAAKWFDQNNGPNPPNFLNQPLVVEGNPCSTTLLDLETGENVFPSATCINKIYNYTIDCYDTTPTITDNGSDNYTICFGNSQNASDIVFHLSEMKDSLDACKLNSGHDFSVNSYLVGYDGTCISDVRQSVSRFILSTLHTYVFDQSNNCITFDDISIPYTNNANGNCCITESGNALGLVDPSSVSSILSIQKSTGAIPSWRDGTVGGTGIPADGIVTALYEMEYTFADCPTVNETYTGTYNYNTGEFSFIEDSSGTELIDPNLQGIRMVVRAYWIENTDGYDIDCNTLDFSSTFNLSDYGGGSAMNFIDGYALAAWLTTNEGIQYEWSPNTCILYTPTNDIIETRKIINN